MPEAGFDAGTIACAFLDPARRFSRYQYHYTGAKLRSDPLYHGVLDALESDAHALLDVGCGLGLLAHVLRSVGRTQPYLGVDFDAKKIALAKAAAARAGLAGAQFATCDLMQGFPAHSGSVAILDVLQYLPREVQQRTVDAALRAVVPGAWLVIRTGLADASRASRVTGLADRIGNMVGWMRTAPKAYPVREVLDAQLRAGGLQPTWTSLSGNTPFNNWLVVAQRAG